MTVPDPFRALDGVDPADRWDDIVDRAEHPSVELPLPLDARRPLHRRPAVLAAAAVLAVVAIAGVAVATRGDDGPERVTAAEGDRSTSTTLPTAAAPSGADAPFWGQRWTITRLEDDIDGDLLDPDGLLPSSGEPLVMVTTPTSSTGARDGTIELVGSCAAARRGSASLGDDGVLATDRASWDRSLPVCMMIDLAAEPIGVAAAILQDAPTVSIDGASMVIEAGANRIEATAEATFAPSALWDHEWTVDELIDDGTVLDLVPPIDGSPLVLRTTTEGFPQETSLGLVVDSAATGSITVAGCNGAGGPAHLLADVLVADPGGFDDATGETSPGWASTDMACSGADGGALMAQDAFLSAFLRSGPTVAVTGAELVIAKGGDRLHATLVLDGGSSPTTTDPGSTETTAGTVTTTVPPPILLPPDATTTTLPEGTPGQFFGLRWTVFSLSGEGASPAYVGAEVDTRDGRVAVQGCNGAGGAMRLDGDRLVVDGEWAHTAMGCAPVAGGADLQAQDAWFEALLRSGPTLRMEGSDAVLTAGDAEVVLVLVRP